MAQFTPLMGQGGLMQSPMQMGQTGQMMGQAIRQGRTNKLMQPAMMGDPQALSALMQIDPQAGMQIQQQLSQQTQQAQQTKMQAQAWMQKNQDYTDKFLKDTSSVIRNLPEEKREDYFNQRVDTLKRVVGPENQWVDEITYENWKDPIMAMGQPSGGFAGTSMTAQSMNEVLKGESDPAYKESPQYKLAVAQLERPQIIQTEEGTKEIPGMNVEAVLGARQQELKSDDRVAKAIKGAEKAKKFSADQNKAYGFSGRMANASETVNRLVEKGFEPAQISEEVAGSVPLLGNLMVSSEYQQYQQAQENWISANLRRESGAVIGENEMKAEKKKYFPIVGDGPDVIEQKAEAREIAEKGMVESSGRKQEDIMKMIEKADGKKKDAATAPQAAIDFLQANPDQSAAFKQKYGYLPEGM